MKQEVQEPDSGSVRLPKNWMSALTLRKGRIDTSWRGKRKHRIQALKFPKNWIKTDEDPQYLHGQGDKSFAKIPGKKLSQLALPSKAAKLIVKQAGADITGQL